MPHMREIRIGLYFFEIQGPRPKNSEYVAVSTFMVLDVIEGYDPV